ncbi:MAG: YcbK family protein [Methylococcales bacterium]|nr:YcbK family protein [Methylococcales bacterium]
MNKQLLTNTANDEDNAIASRRKFLKQLACGSLLAMGGTGAATAAVRHIIYAGRNGTSHIRIHTNENDTPSIRPRFFSRQATPTPRFSNYYGPSHKMLSFEHTHTGDKLKLTYFERGNYVEGALQEINYLLRDYHTDDIHAIDPALLDQLYDLKQTLGVSKPFHIVSGYRSPYTNAQLRRHNHGVAEHSFHMQGRAIDIRVEGVSTRTIKNAALDMARGGVGYYPRNNFVHLDTGEFRTW